MAEQLSNKANDRLPQRFRYQKHGCNGWDFGVCIPCGRLWSVRAGAGFGSFEDDPWEVLGQIIGDVADFQWIDNDFGWIDSMAGVSETREELRSMILANQLRKANDEIKRLSTIVAGLPTTVHERKCHDCGNVALHVDSVVPYVICRKCCSRDTRATKNVLQ